jgi:hypothetical protein
MMKAGVAVVRMPIAELLFAYGTTDRPLPGAGRHGTARVKRAASPQGLGRG